MVDQHFFAKARQNINTILLSVVLAVLGWLGMTVVESSKAIIRLDAVLTARTDEFGRIERQLDEMRTHLNAVELDMARIKGGKQ